MSHLIEEYAKNLGVKISEPIVNDHFFPITQCKYITLNQAGVASKTYSHYDIVLSLLKPFLDRAGIKVIQIGGDKKIEGTEAALNISFKQQAFVLSKSLVHMGCDGALAQVASNKKIPTVTIYGNAFPANVKPFFSKSTINKSIQPNWDKKPCFATEDPKRQIDTIKPEIIAQKVLDLLGIEKESIKFVTKNIGEQLVLHWSQLYKLPAISLRFFNVYGPRARTSGTYGAVFGVFLAQKLANKPTSVAL
jgi:hypothetical protein